MLPNELYESMVHVRCNDENKKCYASILPLFLITSFYISKQTHDRRVSATCQLLAAGFTSYLFAATTSI